MRIAPIGDLGVLEPTIRGPLVERVRASPRGAVIAVPVSRFVSGKKRRIVDRNIESLRHAADPGRRIYWAVVVPAEVRAAASRRARLTTFVCGPDGAVLASIDGAAEAVAYVQVGGGVSSETHGMMRPQDGPQVRHEGHAD